MKLTKRQREVLTLLRDDVDLDLVYSKGGGWWIGNDETNGKLAKFLIQNILVSSDSGFASDFERYVINESGKRALEGLPPYCDCHGKFHEDFYTFMASQRIK